MISLKKIIAVFVLLFGLYSCTKDEATTVSIEGKWEYSQTGELINGVETLENYYSNPCGQRYVEILPGGKSIDYDFDTRETNYCKKTIEESTWTKDNNTFTITGSNPNSRIAFEILELSSTTLKLKGKYTDNGTERIHLIVCKRM